MTSSSVAFADAVIAALRADPDVAAIYGARVYDRAPDAVVYPYISLGPSDFSMEEIGDDCGTLTDETLQIDLWHRDGGALWPTKNGCKAVALALNDKDVVLADYATHRLQLVLARAFPGAEPDATRGVLQFSIRIEE